MEILLLVVEYLVAGFGVLLLILTIYVTATGYYYQGYRGPALEQDLGFQHGTACLPSDNWQGYISAVCVVEVVDDGVFAQAGIRRGDVLPGESNTSFFRRLHRHRGGSVEFAVANGGDGPPFHLRPTRVIRLELPPRGEDFSPRTA